MSDLSVEEFLDLVPVDPSAEAQLLWVDIETTGLEDADVILEVGICISDFDGNVIPDSVQEFLVRERSDHYNDRIANMDDFVMDMHEKSGLLTELDDPGSYLSVAAAQNALLKLCEKHASQGVLMLAGSSVHFDGEKLGRYMPALLNFAHYRQINVSTLKELCKAFNPRVYAAVPDHARNVKAHRVLSDLADSISEYLFYVENFLWVAGSNDGEN